MVLWTIGVYCWSGLFVADVVREFTNINTSSYLEDTKLFEKGFRIFGFSRSEKCSEAIHEGKNLYLQNFA